MSKSKHLISIINSIRMLKIKLNKIKFQMVLLTVHCDLVLYRAVH